MAERTSLLKADSAADMVDMAELLRELEAAMAERTSLLKADSAADMVPVDMAELLRELEAGILSASETCSLVEGT